MPQRTPEGPGPQPWDRRGHQHAAPGTPSPDECGVRLPGGVVRRLRHHGIGGRGSLLLEADAPRREGRRVCHFHLLPQLQRGLPRGKGGRGNRLPGHADHPGVHPELPQPPRQGGVHPVRVRRNPTGRRGNAARGRRRSCCLDGAAAEAPARRLTTTSSPKGVR
ncbi:hypothetical protein SAMN05444392_108131 [Seinonella peptonophila]|uniref:Uncharacterized protein n=1 Tax=Seinonella peptonophila TaxID=112248 RepID=A0A1M4ZAW7_9BACL|nr:hypothetical protein SAMN05444392_108131 [Seinonella peptonophila]